MSAAVRFIGPPAATSEAATDVPSRAGTIGGSATSVNHAAASQPAPSPGGLVRLCLISLIAAALGVCPPAARAQTPAPAQTDLDAFMAQALQRRDVDRKTLSDYVLDETEEFEVLGPGRAPVTRMRREYTWYVRDGIHVRSPLKFNGVPI